MFHHLWQRQHCFHTLSFPIVVTECCRALLSRIVPYRYKCKRWTARRYIQNILKLFFTSRFSFCFMENWLLRFDSSSLVFQFFLFSFWTRLYFSCLAICIYIYACIGSYFYFYCPSLPFVHKYDDRVEQIKTKKLCTCIKEWEWNGICVWLYTHCVRMQNYAHLSLFDVSNVF